MHQSTDKLAPANITHAPPLDYTKPTREILETLELICIKTVECKLHFGLNPVEMVNSKILLICVVLLTAWHESRSASLPFLTSRVEDAEIISGVMHPAGLIRARVREGVPPPLCSDRCFSPPAGPVCAFDAAGTARTFATLCELEAVSCRESVYFAVTSLGEC